MLIARQLRQGSTHQPGCRHQEDHEALQHPGPVQAHIPRIEASKTSQARECVYFQLHLPSRTDKNRSSASATSSSLHWRTCTHTTPTPPPRADLCSYFVTELLGTDLHRLLTSRPLEKQFIQYFLYQILVSGDTRAQKKASLTFPARAEIRPLRRSCAPRPEA